MSIARSTHSKEIPIWCESFSSIRLKVIIGEVRWRQNPKLHHVADPPVTLLNHHHHHHHVSFSFWVKNCYIFYKCLLKCSARDYPFKPFLTEDHHSPVQYMCSNDALLMQLLWCQPMGPWISCASSNVS